MAIDASLASAPTTHPQPLVGLSEESLPEAHPRRQIRQYLRHLFAELGTPLPDEWPSISASAYSQCVSLLRERLDRLYDYLDAQMSHIKSKKEREAFLDQKLMPRYLGETVLYLMQLDYEQPVERHQTPQELATLFERRPEAIIEFDQLYCSVDTTERRVKRILRDFGNQQARVLFLGDDDLGAVALAPRFDGEVHMIDLDDRLHSYVEEVAPSVHRHKADFVLKGIPDELYQSFDAVMLDPPWDEYRLWCFLDKAIFCLKPDPHARIYLAHCPLILEHRLQRLHSFQSRVAKRGFTFDSIETAFNLYSLSEKDLPDFQKRLEKQLPDIESPLLDLIRYIPYAHAQLYVLRRLPGFRHSALQRWFHRWWNRA